MLWLGLPLLVAANASADELPESVWLSVKDCSQPTLKLAEAYSALRLELSQAGMRIVGDNEREQARAELTVELRCDRGIRATLRLRQHQDRSSASRLVALDDTSSKDRARVLALALTELVRTDWAELSKPGEASSLAEASKKPPPPSTVEPAKTETEMQSASTATPSGPAQPPPLPGTEGRHAPAGPTAGDGSWHWRADALIRWFTVSPRPTLGPAFQLSRGRFSAGVEAALGRGANARGVANYGFAAATFGFDAVSTVGNVAGLAVGPRFALGATWFAGDSATATAQGNNVVQLYADARIQCALTLRTATVDVGMQFSGGRANGLRLRDQEKTLGATGGWFTGVALGAGW